MIRPLAAAGALSAAALLAACTSGGSDTTPSTPTVTTTVTASGSSSSTAPTGGVTGSASGGPRTGGSSPTGPVECTPTVATFAVEDGGGAAGTSGVAVVVTNASQQPCVTTGWPGVAVLDAGGAQIEQAQRQGNGTAPQTITLRPGDKASATLTWSNGTGTDGACPQGAAILFTLPDNTDSTRLDVRPLACPDGVRIYPLVAATG